ncbi:hypothetical protein HDU93_001758, partial [Gonapodya sp. JEL0774]
YVYLEETSRTITRAAKNPIIQKPSFSLSDDTPSAPRRGSSGRPRVPRAHGRLRALQGAARREGVELRIMPDGMTRRVTNKTTLARLPPVLNVVPTTSGNDAAATTRGDMDEPEESTSGQASQMEVDQLGEDANTPTANTVPASLDAKSGKKRKRHHKGTSHHPTTDRPAELSWTIEWVLTSTGETVIQHGTLRQALRGDVVIEYPRIYVSVYGPDRAAVVEVQEEGSTDGGERTGPMLRVVTDMERGTAREYVVIEKELVPEPEITQNADHGPHSSGNTGDDSALPVNEPQDFPSGTTHSTDPPDDVNGVMDVDADLSMSDTDGSDGEGEGPSPHVSALPSSAVFAPEDAVIAGLAGLQWDAEALVRAMEADLGVEVVVERDGVGV